MLQGENGCQLNTKANIYSLGSENGDETGWMLSSVNSKDGSLERFSQISHTGQRIYGEESAQNTKDLPIAVSNDLPIPLPTKITGL